MNFLLHVFIEQIKSCAFCVSTILKLSKDEDYESFCFCYLRPPVFNLGGLFDIRGYRAMLGSQLTPKMLDTIPPDYNSFD